MFRGRFSMPMHGSVEEAQRHEPVMEPYDEFLQRVQDIHRLGALQGHLGWDQEVLMPAKGASSRGEMMAWLAGKRHEQLTDSRMGELPVSYTHLTLPTKA